MTSYAPPETDRSPRWAIGRPRVCAPLPLVWLGAIAVVVVASMVSVVVGSEQVALAALWDAGHPQHVIVEARTGRTVAAAVVGAALGVAGACLQGLTRNPLADPGILGINAGASAAMIVAMALLGVTSVAGFVWFAGAGAAIAMVVVHAIAALGPEGATPGRLTIAGAAVTAALTSWTSAVLLVDRQTMEGFRYWQVGSVGDGTLALVADVAPFLLAGSLLALGCVRQLDALALGDDLAAGLGTSVVRARLLIGLGATVLAGTATAMVGPVAFVGLVVPHAARLVVGPSHGRLLPASALFGAVLVLVADTVGRIVLPPTEVQVGIMTALVGLPAFVVILRRSAWGATR